LSAVIWSCTAVSAISPYPFGARVQGEGFRV
jgi:hypothetical protein